MLALLGLVLPLLALCLRPLATDDTWWHLAMGALYASGNLWPTEDPLLHTTVLRPPVPHEWLFQVGLHALHVAAGFQGLRVLHGALAAGILAGAFALFRRASRDVAAAALATAVFACLAWFRLIQLRPDLVSVAAALVLYALVLAPERPGLRRSLAALALLLVWCNAHSLFLIGLALLLAGAAGALFEFLCARAAGLAEAARASLRRAGVLAALCAAGALVTLLNPRGIEQHLTFATESDVGSIWKIRDDFGRWNPFAPTHDLTAFSPLSFALADLLFGAALVVAAWQLVRFARRRDAASLARVDGVHAALAGAALVACLVALRFHWLAFLPLLYLLRRWRERERRLSAADLGFAVATALLAVAMPRANGFGSLFDEVAREPEGWRGGAMDERYCGPGMRFLADAGIEGRLYQPFNEGGYLGYFLAPRLRTFIDGRLDHVPAEVLDDYLTIRRTSRDGPSARLRDRLDRWGVDVFFADTFPESLYPERASGFQLRRLPEWLPIYVSRNCTVYLRRSPANRENLERVVDYYAARGVRFDPSRGFEAARALREAAAWAAEQRIALADEERFEAQRSGADPALRRAALAELAGHAWRIGDYPRALALDEAWLAEDPAAFAPAWQRVDALLSLGRPHAALAAAQALAEAHPDRIESERWLARAERAAARAAPASP
ncbi:MAG TPA: hypothetical protein VFY49_07470 [Myxococcota bacterium]|nr:hypothetical protein [Myxococcota bacterium]